MISIVFNNMIIYKIHGIIKCLIALFMIVFENIDKIV
jgi:hypothetical protein